MSNYLAPAVRNAARSIYDSDTPEIRTPSNNIEMWNIAQDLNRRDIEDRERKRPVEWLFDRLSTGNYLAANIVDQALSGGSAKDWGRALWGSITGEADTTFGDVLRKHAPGLDNPIFKKRAQEGRAFGNVDAAGVFGFALDLLLDPLNYVTFGSTKLAKSAARSFADDSVKHAFLNANILDDAAKALNKSEDAVRSMFNKKPMQLASQLRNVGMPSEAMKSFSMEMDNLWRNKYREGLRMNSDEMNRAMIGMMGEAQTRKKADFISNVVGDYTSRRTAPYRKYFEGTGDASERALQQMDPKMAAVLKAIEESGMPIRDVASSPQIFDEVSPQAFYKSILEHYEGQETQDAIYKMVDNLLNGNTRFDNIDDDLISAIENQAKKTGLIGPEDTLFDMPPNGMYGSPGRIGTTYGAPASSLGDPMDVPPGQLLEKLMHLDASQVERAADVSQGAGKAGVNVLQSFTDNPLFMHDRKADPLLNGYDAFKKRLSGSYQGTRFQDAVWSMMNRGPVGALKRTFGVRTPYQKVLRVAERSQESNYRYNMQKMGKEISDVMGSLDLDEQIKADYVMYRSLAQDMTKPLEERADLYARAKAGLGEFHADMPARRAEIRPVRGINDIDIDTFDSRVSVETGNVVLDGININRQMEMDIPKESAGVYADAKREYLEYHNVTASDIAREIRHRQRISEVGHGFPDYSVVDRTSKKRPVVFPEGFTEEDIAYVSKIDQIDQKVSEILSKWDLEEQEWMAEGAMQFRETMNNYIPLIMKTNRVKAGGKGGRKVMDASVLEQSLGPYKAMLNEEASLRSMYNMTQEEASAMVREQGLTGITTDLHELLLARGAHHEVMRKQVNSMLQFREFGFNRFEKGMDITEEALEILGNESSLNKLGLVKISGPMAGIFSRPGPKGYDYVFDNDVAATIERMTEVMSDPVNANNIFSRYTHWWRGATTATPGFHMRNVISNTTMLYTEFGPKTFAPKNMYDGMVGAAYGLKRFNPKAGEMPSAVRLRLQSKRGAWTLEELSDEALRRGVISESTMANLADDPIIQLMGKTDRSKMQNAFNKYSPASGDNWLFSASRDIGSFAESSARFQAFIMDVDRLTRMGGVATKSDHILDVAAGNAKKLLLDYGDLTKVEQKWFRGIMPFYTWLRKNLANQLTMIGDPQYWSRLSVAPKTINMMKSEDQVDVDVMPEYMREAGYFQTGTTPEGDARLFWPNIPILDLNKLPFSFGSGNEFANVSFDGLDLKNEILDMAHPLLKMFVESVTGYDTFREREIRPTEEGGRMYGLIASHPTVIALLDVVAKAGGKKNGIIAGVDPEGRVQMDGTMLRGIETAMPLINNISRYIDTVEEAEGLLFRSNVIENAVDAFLGASDPTEGTQEALRTMSFALGLKFDSLDEREARIWRASDLYDQALDVRKAEQEMDPNRAFRKMQWQNRQLGMYRRLGVY